METTCSQKKKNKGFSMVELIIVIAIMAVLAGALAPALIKYIEKSRRTVDIGSADELQAALQRVLARTEFPPANGQTIIILNESTTYSDPATSVKDELCIELDGHIPEVKSFKGYYWYIIYDGNYGSVPEVHLTDSATGSPKYELYPDNTDFAEMVDKRQNNNNNN